MAKENSRVRRVGEQLQRQLAVIFQSEITDPRLQMLTIAAVKPSSDLSSAKVYYTLMDSSHRDAAHTALEKATGRIRHSLKDRVEMRIVPKLRFIYDESVQYGTDLSALINKAVTSDEQKRSVGDESKTGDDDGQT